MEKSQRLQVKSKLRRVQCRFIVQPISRSHAESKSWSRATQRQPQSVIVHVLECLKKICTQTPSPSLSRLI